MSTKIVAVLLAAVFVASGVMAFTSNRATTAPETYKLTSSPVIKTSLAPEGATASGTAAEPYVGDFKNGYEDGFTAGLLGQPYPDQSSLTGSSRGYQDGYSQGFNAGQTNQADVRAQLCGNATVSDVRTGYGSSYASSGGRRSYRRVLGTRDYNESYEVDRGIGTGTRRALMVAGGAAAGAGLGAALGGKKGAAIGALAGGGTGALLAWKKKPSRAFNRRVSGKSVAVKTAIGAGAGAAIGALAGGKRGALAGAAIGGGGGALWSLLSGKRTYRRR